MHNKENIYFNKKAKSCYVGLFYNGIIAKYIIKLSFFGITLGKKL